MSYYGFVVTDSGRELIAKLVAGQQLPISKIMVGSGTIPDDVKPAAMTALVEPVAAGTSTAPVYDGASVRMIVEYRSDLNGGLDHGFWLREFGVFAFDPDKGEVLIYYGTLGDYPQYVTVTKTFTFTKAVTAASITLAKPMEADAQITLCAITVGGLIPADAVFKVEVTNNGKDSSPVWEDATTEARNGRNHLFTNQTAANGFAFNFRVTAERGASGESGYIASIQGGFQ